MKNVLTAIVVIAAIVLIRTFAFNVNVKLSRTKHPSYAKLEYMRGDNPVRIIEIEKKNKFCSMTASFDENGTKVTEFTKEVPAEVLLELEDITEKHNMPELKSLPYSDESGERSFSLFYGNISLSHINCRQEQYPEVKALLDELEACIKNYIND